MAGFVFFFSMSDVVSKILYIRNPGLSVVEFLFFRGIVQTLILGSLVAPNFKHIMYDCIPRKMVGSLMIRIASGLISFYCIYQAIKYLPILIVSLIINT